VKILIDTTMEDTAFSYEKGMIQCKSVKYTVEELKTLIRTLETQGYACSITPQATVYARKSVA
jgi:tRNA G26 N,N-dimethylase Trm1